VTISITPSTSCQHYFKATLGGVAPISDLLDVTSRLLGIGVRLPAPPGPGLTVLIGIT